ncbi:hypothetical protein SAMN06296386_104141 [Lachnospiraceae bacterium]|nr:hypothetical protein SAMN06296386_104141 [Lachnospiraceae bacterium]
MEKLFIRQLIATAAAVIIMVSISACGSSVDAAVYNTAGQVMSEVVSEVEEKVATSGEDEVIEGEFSNYNSQIQAVQDTLVFVGGLKTGKDAEKDIRLSIFRNEDAEFVGIVVEDGVINYGIISTQTGTLEDGRSYARMIIDGYEYGYLFNEDIVSGIIIDTEGTMFDAVELTEEEARDYVSQTLGG